MSKWYKGSQPILKCTFTTRDGAAFDPDTVTFEVKTGTADTVTYTDADDNVANPQVGTWECTLPVLTADNVEVTFNCVGSGTLNAAAQGKLAVAELNV